MAVKIHAMCLVRDEADGRYLLTEPLMPRLPEERRPAVVATSRSDSPLVAILERSLQTRNGRKGARQTQGRKKARN